MIFDIKKYNSMLTENGIDVIYSGPIWADGIGSMAEMLIKRLEYDGIPLSALQSVFSAFVEQMNNILMYSAEKKYRENTDRKRREVSKGIFVLAVRNSAYIVQTGNFVTPSSAEILKARLDHLNTLDKKELRQYYKQQLLADNNNPESKGAGIGLIEIARRASEPIDYKFETLDDGRIYFSMYVTINQKGKE